MKGKFLAFDIKILTGSKFTKKEALAIGIFVLMQN